MVKDVTAGMTFSEELKSGKGCTVWELENLLGRF
jgi:hypothetical protein